jgi:hypothetical protein
MKTKTINLYSFNELPVEIQSKVINNLSDINLDYQWWNDVFDDAKNIGLKIESFNLEKNYDCNGDFFHNAYSVASKIIQEHGKDCETFKTAEKFSSDYDNLVAKYSDGIDKTKVTYKNEFDFDDECDDLNKDFLNSLLADYWIILSKEYDYLTSEAQIIETIKANEYYFTIDGRLESL